MLFCVLMHSLSLLSHELTFLVHHQGRGPCGRALSPGERESLCPSPSILNCLRMYKPYPGHLLAVPLYDSCLERV
jgi:hypothetical protein